MIDWTRVEELRDEIGAEDFSEVVELFLSEVEERIELASAKTVPAELAEDLHFLKGSALNLGFSEFAQRCSEGEANAANGLPFDSIQTIEAAYQSAKGVFLNALNEGTS